MFDFRFRCTGCGKCCTTAPEITVTEAMSLYRDFVLMLKLGGVADASLSAAGQVRAMNGGVDMQACRNQFEHLVSMGAVVVQAGGLRAAIRLSAMTVASAALGRCPKVAPDGSCAIYERRPSLCRALPLDYWSAEADQPLRIMMMADRVGRGEYPCDMSRDAPPLWADGQLAVGPYRDAWLAGIESSRQDWPILSVLQAEMQNGNPGLPSIEQVVGAILARESYQLDFLGALLTLTLFQRSGAAGAADLPPLPEPQAFLEAQLGLIRDQLADNLRRKAAADRPVTERLRALERHYAQALRERPWEEETAA